MTTRPEVSVDHLRFDVSCTRGDDNSVSFELRLMDAYGASIMALKLPESAIKMIKEDGTCWQFTMSPDGSLAVNGDSGMSARQNGLGLDELIQQSLAPDMLEDEPHLQTQLKELKHKLIASMVIVDRVLSALPQDDF